MKRKNENADGQAITVSASAANGEIPLDLEDKALAVFQPKEPAVIKAVNVKKTLTPPLVSISHAGRLLMTMNSEPYLMKLPVKGKTEVMGDATVVEGWDVMTGQYILLVLTTMMKNALERDHAPIKGRTFGFEDHDMHADKAYRHVEVVEVELELEGPPAAS